MSEKATSIKNEGAEVRILVTDGGTLFSLRDVLTACGIKFPARWMSRARQTNAEDLRMEKRQFPIMTEYGRRQIEMIFIDASTGRKVVAMLSCGDETRKWLENKVFTYGQKESGGCGPEKETPIQEPMLSASVINSRIDKILMELLEIKKAVNGVGI